MNKSERSATLVPAVGAQVERVVWRLEPDLAMPEYSDEWLRQRGQVAAGFLAQIEACRRDVAAWPTWMRATASAPKWMEGWDD